MQRDLRDMIDQRCREQEPILQYLWKEQSVDSYWQWVNWCVRDAMQYLLPRLLRPTSAWDSPLLEHMRMEHRDHKRAAAVLSAEMRGRHLQYWHACSELVQAMRGERWNEPTMHGILNAYR